MDRFVTGLFSTLFLFFFAFNCSAETVQLKNASGRDVTAEYLQGTNTGSPVLILHGFLQTNKFSTVTRLASSLADLGFTVLSPTLSLGISNRKVSLSCEAIHTHSLDSDANELKLWIEWLNKKTQKPVTLIGHSAGGPVILKYLEMNNAEKIQHAILISLSYYDFGPDVSKQGGLAEKALNAVEKGENPLDTYSLDYCKTYPTNARSFLSYYNWDRLKISSVVGEYSDRITIILGTDDNRMKEDWKNQLNKQHDNVVFIDGANHFFDQAHEFELTDAIEDVLDSNAER